jgi:mevalonate pyrophosphate decarboxylase
MLKVCKRSTPESEGGCGGKPQPVDEAHFDRVHGPFKEWSGIYSHVCRKCKSVKLKKSMAERVAKDAAYRKWRAEQDEKRARELLAKQRDGQDRS